MCRLLVFLAALSRGLFAGDPQSLPRAHAHNDYEHTRPLLDALAQGFGSVEADVWPIDGELLVAHDREKIQPGRTLEKLYLAPLKSKFDSQRGQILPGLGTLILLIDIKTNGLGAYQLLEKQIEKYRLMLTVFENSDIRTNAVTIILSGDRPRAYLEKQPKRWAALDGRLSDLPLDPPRALVPLISDSWNTHFKWRSGPIPAEEIARVKELVAQAHRQGRLVRFWAAPDRPDAWGMLFDAGVDLINTDRLAELAAFLKDRSR